MRKLFYWLPHAVAFGGIVAGGLIAWLRDHGTDLAFGLALVNAVGVLALAVAPDGFWIAVGGQ